MEGNSCNKSITRTNHNILWNNQHGFDKFKHSIRNIVYPLHGRSIWAIEALVIGLHWSGKRLPFNMVNNIIPFLPISKVYRHFVACTITGLGIWFTLIYTTRSTLTLLLMYKGWMYESREKGSPISFATKLWASLLRILTYKSKPGMLTFQSIIPRLPVPSVHETTQKYLRSMRPLLDDKDYSDMEKMAKEFEATIANRLQRYLKFKSWWSPNYISDWWEEYIYLRSRNPLMINSNVYGTDTVFLKSSEVQAARAAEFTHRLLSFRDMILRENLEPIMVQGIVPMCMLQYKRLFHTVRIPGEVVDQMVSYKDSIHIAVFFKGCYYKVITYYRGRLLKSCEIQIQLESILKSNEVPVKGEKHIGAFTAGNRTSWAKIRNTVFSKGRNKTSLDTIESACFFLTLDDIPFEFDVDRPEKLDKYGATLLHGKGYDRWFDKSLTFCVGTNGRIGFNVEHTWGDAPVLCHMFEFIYTNECFNNRYDDNGNTIGTKEFDPPAPQRLKWDFDENIAIPAIEKAYHDAQALINNVDLRILFHNQFGKGYMKTCSVSPDAYIQMALQLAYYRDAGHFTSTYEATITRLYREGRTETVRSCTLESSEWIKAMVDDNSSLEERVRLLRKACNRHQIAYQDAMCGKGLDRHLFGLYVVSKYLNVKSPFLEAAVGNVQWHLSTSQQPPSQTNLPKHPKSASAGGGFGPVTNDGYGVSYFLPTEDFIYFHISSKKMSPKTNSGRFADQIVKAMADIRNLFDDFKSIHRKSHHIEK